MEELKKLKNQYILKNGTNSSNYDTIRLKNKNYLVHRLVGKYFVNGYDDTNKVIDHIDNNRKNNFYKNLRWVSHSENMKKAFDQGRMNQSFTKEKSERVVELNKKYKPKKVRCIEDDVVFNSIREAAKAYGNPNAYTNFSAHMSGKHKQWLGKTWKYEKEESINE